MKYCHRCHRLTLGEPVFCNYCGSSYGVKLCGRLHPNPRSAANCSQCGSRDFSTPQPKVPLILRPFVSILQVAPKLIGFALFIGALYLGVRSVAHDPQFVQSIACILFICLVGVVLWKFLPKWLQGFLKTAFHFVAFLLKTAFRLLFSQKRASKRARYRT